MSDTATALLPNRTGYPVYSTATTTPIWAQSVTTTVGIIASLLDFRITPARETVHLDRTQQRSCVVRLGGRR